eukprot:tig00000227_g19844.t1
MLGGLGGVALNLLFLVLAIATPLLKGGPGAESAYVAFGICGASLAVLAASLAFSSYSRKRAYRATTRAAMLAMRWRSRTHARAAGATTAWNRVER